MKKFKALYKAMYDDLKDADMMIDYACEIREEDPADKNLADKIAEYADFRLKHLLEFHKYFTDEAAKVTTTTEKTVSDCMWEETHENYTEWYRSIKNKIEKY